MNSNIKIAYIVLCPKHAGQINNIATVEIEEGLFNKTKTDFLKVNKDDFNKKT